MKFQESFQAKLNLFMVLNNDILIKILIHFISEN